MPAARSWSSIVRADRARALPRARWLCGLLCGLATSALPAPAALGPVQTVEAYHAALARGDAQAALRLLATNVVLYEQGFEDRGRAEYAGAHLAADAAFASATKRQVLEQRTLPLGKGYACVLTRTHTRGTFQNQPIDLLGTETALLRHTAAGWIVVHLHGSAHPAGDGTPQPQPPEESKR
jgi:ketosteroid isomerase-like protein